MRPAALLLPALLLAAHGCRPALREPPAVELLAGKATGADPAELLRQSAAEYATREPPRVRRAADLALAAVAERRDDPRTWLAAVAPLVWLAANLDEPAERRQAALDAVDAAQWCGRADAGRVECDYWLALALGVQARERRSTGHDALPRIEELLLAVREREPGLDASGPDRVLALLYLRAPGWPAGPGDHETGLEHAREAQARHPDYPPNLLALAEALVATGDRAAGIAVYKRALEAARQHAAQGDPDAPRWVSEAEKAIDQES